MKIVEVKLDAVKPYARNQKKHPAEQVKNIATSIKKYGFVQPVVLDMNNEIIIGHGRILAAKQLELETIPCVYAENLTEEQIRELRIIDNKLNESEWEWDFLKKDLQELDFSDFDIDFGLDTNEESKEVVEDEPPEIDELGEPTAKPGDIWQLGRHRLMCGDSTKQDDVQKLTGGGEVDMVLTDPPYGISAVNGKTGTTNGNGVLKFGSIGENNRVKTKVYKEIKGDDSTDTARLNYEIIKDVSKMQILFGGNYFTDFLPPSRCWLVWDKGVPKETTFAQAELAWCSKDGNAKIYKQLWSGLAREGDREAELTARVHPTQKPVGMLSEILMDYSSEGDNIMDCFGGSGSTLIACEQTNRNCFMIEYEPAYVDVIIQRWENLTGKKAVLLNDSEENGGDKHD